MYTNITEERMQTVCVKTIVNCDKCNVEILPEAFDAFECELNYKEGSCYPDGGNTYNIDIHMCKTCANELIELLRQNGYRINESEHSW